jgi:hypothetical protein
MASAFKPYEGDKPFVFVSYSHQNSDEVLPILQKLHDRGLRLWYDSGITPGSEWAEEIGNHILGCGLFLLFMSPEASESHNVKSEITMALEEKKPLMNVYLCDTTLPVGLRLQLGNFQHISYSSSLEDDGFGRFTDRLFESVIKKEQGVLGPPPNPLIAAMENISKQLSVREEIELVGADDDYSSDDSDDGSGVTESPDEAAETIETIETDDAGAADGTGEISGTGKPDGTGEIDGTGKPDGTGDSGDAVESGGAKETVASIGQSALPSFVHPEDIEPPIPEDRLDPDGGDILTIIQRQQIKRAQPAIDAELPDILETAAPDEPAFAGEPTFAGEPAVAVMPPVAEERVIAENPAVTEELVPVPLPVRARRRKQSAASRLRDSKRCVTGSAIVFVAALIVCLIVLMRDATDVGALNLRDNPILLPIFVAAAIYVFPGIVDATMRFWSLYKAVFVRVNAYLWKRIPRLWSYWQTLAPALALLLASAAFTVFAIVFGPVLYIAVVGYTGFCTGVYRICMSIRALWLHSMEIDYETNLYRTKLMLVLVQATFSICFMLLLFGYANKPIFFSPEGSFFRTLDVAVGIAVIPAAIVVFAITSLFG